MKNILIKLKESEYALLKEKADRLGLRREVFYRESIIKGAKETKERKV